MTHVSFEFFPPKTEEGRSKLVVCANELARFDPAFVSVTYGAGGTSQDRTLATVAALASALDVAVAGHLTTVSATSETVHRVIDAYRDLGITRIVALRGDPPIDGPDPALTGYETAVDLVAGIRARPDGARFDISVAAYPEVHPKAASARADLDNLKRKIDAGADRAITQFFYDNEVFLRFRDRAGAAGIEVPIVPGIMPVNNFAGVKRFSQQCGASIPRWLEAVLADLDDDPEVQQLVAATLAAEQCQELAEHGVDTFHFYTLNRRHLTSATCHRLGLLDATDDSGGYRAAAARGGAELQLTAGGGR